MAANLPPGMQVMAAFPCCISLGFLAAAGLILNDAFQQYQLSQKIRNTPTSKARSAAVGLVELSGKAKSLDRLTSPITKSACAYYDVRCEYYYHTKNSSGWRQFYRECPDNRFYIEDDSGKVQVETKGSRMNIKPDFTFKGTLSDKSFFGLLPSNQVDKQALDYLRANPKAAEAAKPYNGRQLRFVEYIIVDGDPLYVLGSAEPMEGAVSGVASENLVIRKNPREKILMISEKSEKLILGVLSLRFYIEMVFGLITLTIALLTMVTSIGLLIL